MYNERDLGEGKIYIFCIVFEIKMKKNDRLFVRNVLSCANVITSAYDKTMMHDAVYTAVKSF